MGHEHAEGIKIINPNKILRTAPRAERAPVRCWLPSVFSQRSLGVFMFKLSSAQLLPTVKLLHLLLSGCARGTNCPKGWEIDANVDTYAARSPAWQQWGTVIEVRTAVIGEAHKCYLLWFNLWWFEGFFCVLFLCCACLLLLWRVSLSSVLYPSPGLNERVCWMSHLCHGSWRRLRARRLAASCQ